MDIIEDFTEFVKRINENDHREKLEHICTDEKRSAVGGQDRHNEEGLRPKS